MQKHRGNKVHDRAVDELAAAYDTIENLLITVPQDNKRGSGSKHVASIESFFKKSRMNLEKSKEKNSPSKSPRKSSIL